VTTAILEAPRTRTPSRRRHRSQVSKWARPVQPIKAIWDQATEEERKKARELVTELLGYWLGQQSKAELAQRLSVPPIRVWQMSQRAMAGMVAAMLRPPSGRRGRMPKLDPEVKELRKRIAELEHANELLTRLVRLLRTMPGNEHRELPKEERRAKRASGRRKKAVEPRGPGADPGALPDGT
jgi:hypothetical protein